MWNRNRPGPERAPGMRTGAAETIRKPWPEALIWDVDGTLVDNEEMHRSAFNRAFSNNNLPWQWDRELYAELMHVTGGKERIRHYIELLNVGGAGIDTSDDFVKAIHADKIELYTAMLRSLPVPLRPGVRHILREAQARGIQLAIATTSCRINVLTLLERTLAKENLHWRAIITGDDVQEKKPSPEVYLLALEILGLPPEACLAVEDSPVGLAAAKAAGIKTVVITNQYTFKEDFSNAYAVYFQLGEHNDSFPVLLGAAPGSRICRNSS